MNNPLRILGETRIPLEGARPLLGTAKDPASMATVRRATHVGARTSNGGRVYLEFLKTGLKVFTSVEAVERYLAAINGFSPDAPEVVSASPARGKRRQEELARTEREADLIGI